MRVFQWDRIDESQWNHFMIHMDMCFRKTDRLKNSSFLVSKLATIFFRVKCLNCDSWKTRMGSKIAQWSVTGGKKNVKASNLARIGETMMLGFRPTEICIYLYTCYIYAICIAIEIGGQPFCEWKETLKKDQHRFHGCQTNTGVDFLIYCDFVHRKSGIFCWLLRLTWHHVKTNEDKKWYKNSDHDQHHSSFICNCYPPSKICTSLNLPNHPTNHPPSVAQQIWKFPGIQAMNLTGFSKLRGKKTSKNYRRPFQKNLSLGP